MKRQQWGLYAVALAILIVGLVAVGVPASTLLLASLVLVCPLMMFFMMRGMHGGEGHPGHDEHHSPPTPDTRQHDDRHGATRP